MLPKIKHKRRGRPISIVVDDAPRIILASMFDTARRQRYTAWGIVRNGLFFPLTDEDVGPGPTVEFLGSMRRGTKTLTGYYSVGEDSWDEIKGALEEEALVAKLATVFPL